MTAATAFQDTAADSATASGPVSFRTDIQALRALAVGAVFLYHLWPNRLTGGYVGVDIFFVISGFLIAEHLVREIDSTGRIRIATFWARRARRLLPAALLTITVTAVATRLLAPTSRWEQYFSEMLASVLYVENWKLAADSIDYLAASNSPSPVQHYWTLSAEEQFYFALPLILVAVLWAAQRSSVTFRRAATLTVAVLIVGSFTLSVAQTTSTPGVAYFSTLTRGWEFLAGVGLALAASRFNVGRRTGHALAVGGTAFLLLTFVRFSATTPFPGYAAALPVLATIAVIAAGARQHTVLSTVGAWRPVAHIGRISFAIYLWHFPLIVLMPYATQRPLTTVDKALIGALTLILATASTTLVEDKIRFSPRLLGGRRPRTVAIVSLAMMSVAASTVAPVLISQRQAEQEQAAVMSSLLADLPPCFGAAALAEPECAAHIDDAPLFPVSAAKDSNRPECWTTGGESTFRHCTLGPKTGYSRHLIAVGDSHNNALIDAYEAIGKARNWRIDVAGRRGCYWTEAHPQHPSDEIKSECTRWRELLVEHLAAVDDLDAIIVTHARSNGRIIATQGRSFDKAVAEDQANAWANRPDLTVPIIAVADNPHLPPDAIDCLAQNLSDPSERCATSRGTALADSDGMKRAARIDPNAKMIDLTDLFCTTESCSAVVGGAQVYTDGNHLTRSYAISLAPYLGEALAEALD